MFFGIETNKYLYLFICDRIKKKIYSDLGAREFISILLKTDKYLTIDSPSKNM